MTVERGHSEYPSKARRRARGWGSLVPVWYLRMRLHWAGAGIDRIERQLASEFATLDTAPLHAELEALIAERDALKQRIAQST
ncbi:MAG: hypothetical protein ABI781_12770 [Burkholderiales bacterium]